MNIAFAGFRHSHIFGLYNMAKKSERVNICGCFEEDGAARAEAERAGVNFNYSSYAEILEDRNVDAVAVGDYYGRRGRMVIEALKCGKHVICDKPICTDASELEEIKRLSEEKNLKVCCMLDLRYMPQVKKVRELAKTGKLGKIYIASFTGQHFLNPESRPRWYFEAGKHGGTINDIAIHGIDLLRYITKENLSDISFAKTWNAFAFKTPEFKDCAQFAVKLGDIAVMADVSYAAPNFEGILPTYWEFTFWGSEAMARFSYKDNKLHVFKNTEEIIECEEAESNWLEDFVDETEGIKTGIMDTADILESQRQVLKIQMFADKEI